MRIHTIQLNIEDFLSGTIHMDATELGAYMSLLIACYQSGNKLPNDDKRLARMAKVSPKIWKRIKPIIEVKFTKSDSYWTHERCQKEFEKCVSLSTKNRANVLKRYKTDLPVVDESYYQNATNTNNYNLVTNIKEKENNNNKLLLQKKKKNCDVSDENSFDMKQTFLMPDGTFENVNSLFERFWKNYPKIRSKGHKGQAKEMFIRKLKGGKSYEVIGRGITRYRRYCEQTGEKNKDFVRWLRDECWENEYTFSKTIPRPSTSNSIGVALELARADKSSNPDSIEKILEDFEDDRD